LLEQIASKGNPTDLQIYFRQATSKNHRSLFHLNEAARVHRPLEQGVADDELVFRTDPSVQSRLELAVSQMFFFHPHEGFIRGGFVLFGQPDIWLAYF